MTEQSVFNVLNRSISTLNEMLRSTEVAHNGVNMAQIEEVENDLRDVLTVLNRIKGALCGED